MVSNFCEWKKPVWKCPLDEKVRSLIRKNQCGIDTLRLEVPIFTRSARECIMRFVNKRLREKKDQCEVAKQCKSNPKKFWKYVNSKSKSQTRIGDIKTMGADNRVLIANDDEDKANIFVDYFTGVYTRELKEEFNELQARGLAFPCDDIFFSEEVVLNKLNNLKVNKSPGPDSLPLRILYEVRHQIATPLYRIFETSYNTGVTPPPGLEIC